ncbi:MAG: SdrD B-like domain-containing protein, partial [bacterium]
GDSPPKYQGINIKVTDRFGVVVGRDTTKADGSFLVPIERTGTYRIEFQYTNVFGDVVEWHASAIVDVPSVGGVAPINPLNSIGGMLIDASTGQPLRKSGIAVILSRTDSDNPPSGRTTPTVAPTDNRGLFAFDSLAPGSYTIHVADARFAGTLSLPSIKPGSFVIDANLALAEGPTFEVVKTANKRIAEIGDAITYNLEIRNLSTNALLRNVRLVDDLPVAFVYAKNSCRRDSASLREPLNARKLEWDLGDSLKPGEVIRISYTVYVGSAALEGDGINKAYAIAENIVGQPFRTAVASVQVLVRPGVFTDRGIVIGKVFYDKNENGNQDADEDGIPDVELWMEDGTHIVTGDDGKYSLPEVLPGQHVMRINQRTLPVGSTSVARKSASAGDGLTRFVQLTEGGIARVDFYIRPSNQASLKVFFSTTKTDSGDVIHARYVIELNDVGSPTSVRIVDTLFQGYHFALQSITTNGKKLETGGSFSSSIGLEIPVHESHSSDSIDVIIVPDSSEQKSFGNKSKLTLAYGTRRPSEFPGVISIREDSQHAHLMSSRVHTLKSASPAEETILY